MDRISSLGNRVGRALLIAAAIHLSAFAAASEFRLVDDFAAAEEAVEMYSREFEPESVLLVVDIDNTVLSMDDPLGSEQWFDWQSYLQKYEKQSRHLVADTFPGILEVQGKLYERGGMHPPQADLPAILARVQESGAGAIVLTSRGEAFRAATERELKRNGFDFARSALPTREPSDSLYMPYDPNRPAAAGIEAREVGLLKLEEPKEVSYANGIMMTSGQHKGIMLVTLLHRATRPVKAVVFVDNRADHVAGVYDQMLEEKVAVSALVYQREDNNIKAFNYGSKDAYTAAWRRLDSASRATVVDSYTPAPRRSRLLHRRVFCR